MSERLTRVSFLILHGWGGSGPEHWQTWLAERADEHTVVCHSLACCLWLHHRARGGPPAQRVLLVAPPCLDPPPPELASFFPVPREPPLGDNARLVCSDDDPYCASAAGVYGA